jgi:hypothetical protein
MVFHNACDDRHNFLDKTHLNVEDVARNPTREKDFRDNFGNSIKLGQISTGFSCSSA